MDAVIIKETTTEHPVTLRGVSCELVDGGSWSGFLTPGALVHDPDCGRCGGPAGEDGAWCSVCLTVCRDYTRRLDFAQVTEEVNDAPLPRAAELYARAGVPVFPLVPGSKVPATRRGFKAASNDADVVVAWWVRWPAANIGLATGAPWADVLDVDDKDGRPGSDSLARLRLRGLTEGAWGAAGTPSGGRHVLFSPTEQGNHADARSGLDLRSFGGYVVVSPSVTELGRYRWQWVDPDVTARVFDWPASMQVLHGAQPRPQHHAGGGPREGLAGPLRYLAEAPAGERNTRLYWAACRAHEDGQGTEELAERARALGLSEREIRATIKSATTSPVRRLAG